MSTLTIHLPELLDATLAERVKASGARSKEEYLLSLVESDCVAGTLEQALAERRPLPDTQSANGRRTDAPGRRFP